MTGFASALFNLDDYAAGERMISREEDPVWGADVLMRLANMAQPAGDGPVLAATSLRKEAAQAPRSAPVGFSLEDSRTFGKEVSYRSVFQNQTRPQTESVKR